jgi:nucleoid DNA-binding protein
MATEIISFPVNLRKVTSPKSLGYGKVYAELDAKEPLSLKGFARQLTEHGKIVAYSMTVLVLQTMVNCLKELMVQGQPVKLDGLGTFKPVIENDGTKAAESVEATLEGGLNQLIKGVHLRFLPENAKGEKLTSRALKNECMFRAAYVVASKKKTIDGKEKRYQEKIPISSFAIATAEPSNP